MSLGTLIELYRELNHEQKSWNHLVDGVTTSEINVSIFQERPFSYDNQTYRSAFVAYQAQKVSTEFRQLFQDLQPEDAFKLMLCRRSFDDHNLNKYQLMYDIIKRQAQSFPAMQTMLKLHKDSFIHEDTHESTYWKINLPHICAEIGRHLEYNM